MLRRFWLFFAQAVTVLLALMFIVATLKPQWLQRQGTFGKQLAVACDPSDDQRASASYRRKVLPGLIRRAVHAARPRP